MFIKFFSLQAVRWPVQRCLATDLLNYQSRQCVSIHSRSTVSVKSESVHPAPRPDCTEPVIWHIPALLSCSNGQLNDQRAMPNQLCGSLVSVSQPQGSLLLQGAHCPQVKGMPQHFDPPTKTTVAHPIVRSIVLN